MTFSMQSGALYSASRAWKLNFEDAFVNDAELELLRIFSNKLNMAAIAGCKSLFCNNGWCKWDEVKALFLLPIAFFMNLTLLETCQHPKSTRRQLDGDLP